MLSKKLIQVETSSQIISVGVYAERFKLEDFKATSGKQTISTICFSLVVKSEEPKERKDRRLWIVLGKKEKEREKSVK